MSSDLSELFRWLDVPATISMSNKEKVIVYGSRRLGIESKDVTIVDKNKLKKAFNKAALIYHPDKQNGSTHAFLMLQKLVECIETLDTLDTAHEPLVSERPKPKPNHATHAPNKRWKIDPDLAAYLSSYLNSRSVFANGAFRHAASVDHGKRTPTNRVDHGKEQVAQTNNTVDLIVTLEEIACGCSKEIEYSILTLDSDSNGRVSALRRIRVDLPRGFKDNIIRVGGAGDMNRDNSPSDLDVVVKVAPHKHYTRQDNGANLLITRELSMRKSLEGISLAIPDIITGETIEFEWKNICSDVVGGVATCELKGRGMYKGKSTVRGDIVIKVKIIDTMNNDEQTRMFKDIFSGYKTT